MRRFTHDDFQAGESIPGHPDPPAGEIPGWECYELEYGPELRGPYPVIVRESRSPHQPGKFIRAGAYPYWHRYDPDGFGWGQSGYYLCFVPEGTPVALDDEDAGNR